MLCFFNSLSIYIYMDPNRKIILTFDFFWSFASAYDSLPMALYLGFMFFFRIGPETMSHLCFWLRFVAALYKSLGPETMGHCIAGRGIVFCRSLGQSPLGRQHMLWIPLPVFFIFSSKHWEVLTCRPTPSQP